MDSFYWPPGGLKFSCETAFDALECFIVSQQTQTSTGLIRSARIAPVLSTGSIYFSCKIAAILAVK